MNNLVPMKKMSLGGVHGKLNWRTDYKEMLVFIES